MEIDEELVSRLEDFVRDLRHERGELEGVIQRGREVASEIRSAAKSASEAAGWIANEASRLRR